MYYQNGVQPLPKYPKINLMYIYIEIKLLYIILFSYTRENYEKFKKTFELMATNPIFVSLLRGTKKWVYLGKMPPYGDLYPIFYGDH